MVMVDNNFKEIIDNFKTTKTYEQIKTGQKYYLSENENIMKRRHLLYVQHDENGAEELIDDPYKANNKLASGYTKILVDQKVQYSLGKPLSIMADKHDVLEELNKEKFTRAIKKIAKEAAKTSIGWGHVYIDKNKDFRVMHIPSSQCIPVYNGSDAEELTAVYRFYEVDAMTKSGAIVKVTRVEYWTQETVTIYQQNPDTLNYELYEEERKHIQQKYAVGKKIETLEGKSWGIVPFIPFYNNDENVFDLQTVKNYIDVYDVVTSDFANNLEDFQDVYWILKGYNGESLSTFLADVKKYKTLKTAEDGDAKTEQIQIPHEARTKMLDRLNDDIFKFGRGVDTDKAASGNLTNVVIKARFANLDLKASEFETQCKEFISKVIDLYNVYQIIILNGFPIGSYTVTFNRSLIFNEKELLDANALQQGKVSELTRLQNHSWVTDAEKEIKQMEEEMQLINPIILDDAEDNAEDGEDVDS
jgi:SPP1 family phage portal protein